MYFGPNLPLCKLLGWFVHKILMFGHGSHSPQYYNSMTIHNQIFVQGKYREGIWIN